MIENIFTDWFEERKHFFIPDERTKKYFNSIKSNIGLTKVEYSKKWVDLEDTRDFKVSGMWVVSSELGKIDNYFVVQYSERVDIDDYMIVRYWFSRYPTKKDFETGMLLKQIETDLMVDGWNKVKFYCWECGKETHFLDIKGTFEQKVQQWKEKYCGYC